MVDARAAAPDTSVSPIEQVQIFGRRDSRDTQKALRFFRERRIAVMFVDLAIKPMAPAELRRFSDRFKPRSLIDETSKTFAQAGLGYIRLEESEWFDRLLGNQRLLRLPLVRAGRELSVGHDETAWKRWLNTTA